MTFVLHRTIGQRVVLNQIRSNILRIGRGTNADLRSEDATVALEHAVIEHGDQGFVLVDRGSITGTYLNGKPVESARLSAGDVIEVGSLRLRVQVADPAQPMFLKVETIAPDSQPAEIGSEAATSAPAESAKAAAERRETLVAPKVDYLGAYQLQGSVFTKATVVAICAAAAAAAILGVVHERDETAFRPGGLSSAHTTIAISANCAACHDPWQGVSDQKCVSCHASPEHTENQVRSPSCTSCHVEHREFARLQLVGDTTCAGCHADLMVRDGEPTFARKITSFGVDHPEFALGVATENSFERVRLTEAAAQQSDRTVLLFNHHRHLTETVRNADGELVRLTCQDCHAQAELRDEIEPQKLSFETACQSCHVLTFDKRFPDTQVPHGGDPDLLYSFLLNVYSANQNLIGRSPQQARRILSRSATAPPSAQQQALFAAEQVIKTKCGKCHELTRTEGRLQVTAPQFRVGWFPHATFRHRPHLGIECQDCHQAKRSSDTADVIMPSITVCKQCHGRPQQLVAAGFALVAMKSSSASGSCTSCHVYHQRSKEGPWQRGSIALAAQTATPLSSKFPLGSPLLIVIAVFVALFLLALYFERRRLHRERLPDITPPKPGTGRGERKAGEAPPEPTVAMPMAGTVRMDLGAPLPGGTEMIQWYGTLRWTSGPMMGQKLPITADGYWIGRDGDLSQIVINDNRISRKHVWVGPRAGKVMARDEGSTNGTFLSSAPTQRITEVDLKAGDQVILGEGVATFEYIP